MAKQNIYDSERAKALFEKLSDARYFDRQQFQELIQIITSAPKLTGVARAMADYLAGAYDWSVYDADNDTEIIGLDFGDFIIAGYEGEYYYLPLHPRAIIRGDA